MEKIIFIGGLVEGEKTGFLLLDSLLKPLAKLIKSKLELSPGGLVGKVEEGLSNTISSGFLLQLLCLWDFWVQWARKQGGPSLIGI